MAGQLSHNYLEQLEKKITSEFEAKGEPIPAASAPAIHEKVQSQASMS